MAFPGVSLDTGLGILAKASRFFKRTKLIGKPMGYLGYPVCGGLNKYYPPQGEEGKKPTGFLGFIKRNFLWGYVLGILGAIGWFVTGRQMSAPVEGQPPPAASWSNKFFKAVTIGSPVLAFISDYMGLNALWVCGPEVYRRARFASLDNPEKPLFAERPSDKLIEKTENSKLRFNQDIIMEDGISEDKNIRRFCRAKRGALKALLIGPAGTGKTEAMEYICGEIVKREGKDKVIVKRLDCDALILAARMKEEDEGALVSIAETAGGGAAELARAARTNSIEAVIDTLISINDQTAEAKKNGKRLIIQFDELDKLLRLAQRKDREGNWEFDDDVIKSIITPFQKVADNPDLDIIFTSNADVEDILGLHGHKVSDPDFAGILRRLKEKRVIVSKPTPMTQARITATYLLGLPEQIGIEASKLFDGMIWNKIKNLKTEQAKEDALTEIIYKYIFKPIYHGGKTPQVVRDKFSDLVGSNIEIGITQLIPQIYADDFESGKKLTMSIINGALYKRAEADEALDKLKRGKRR